MHINDEKRPKINGFPAYFYTPEAPRMHIVVAHSIIHYPRITSVCHHLYRLSFTLKCPDESFTYFEKSTLINKTALQSVLSVFEEDPENFIRDVFAYVFAKDGVLREVNKNYGARKNESRISTRQLSRLSLEDI